MKYALILTILLASCASRYERAAMQHTERIRYTSYEVDTVIRLHITGKDADTGVPCEAYIYVHKVPEWILGNRDNAVRTDSFAIWNYNPKPPKNKTP